MNKKLNLSMNALEQWRHEQRELHRQLLKGNFVLDETMIVHESTLAKLLGVGEHTMRNYRAQHLLHYIKLRSQVFYIKPLVFLDLLDLCQK
ncbi:MAG: hypothetical protein BGO40_07365 [Chryseobacterium sp. 39-10]|nr:hypothetical protein [Chryseobacterium sp.]OJV45849.1 MAG: hypothetical protein BGO40_07365 [Chryseobacterium sp. 39-10]